MRDTIAEALQRIGAQPGLAPELYEILRVAPLLVPVSRLAPTASGVGMTAIALWQSPTDGSRFAPLFSATERVPSGAPANVTFVWDTLRRLTEVLPGTDFRLNPSGPIAYDLSAELAKRIVAAPSPPDAIPPAIRAAGSEISLGHPMEHHAQLIAALRTHFGRQHASPAVYLYELYQAEGQTMHRSLAIGVVGGFDPTTALAIEAIVPESYAGALPVELCFIGDNPEVLAALASIALMPTVDARTPGRS